MIKRVIYKVLYRHSHHEIVPISFDIRGFFVIFVFVWPFKKASKSFP